MDESGAFVYDFYGGSGEALYTQVQRTVDECRKEGADYVVALAHLGDDESSEPFRSIDLIAGTSGIDAVLDGHSHSVIPCDVVKNKTGKEVLLSSAGTGLANIGQLVITTDGNLTAGLIGSFPDVDGDINAFMDNTLTLNEGMLDYQALITYITDYLGGTVGETYAGPQGRITVK